MRAGLRFRARVCRVKEIDMAEKKEGRNIDVKNSKQQELVIKRIFDAPRELVWDAWTEPEQIMRWWGPKGFSAPVAKIDLRVGGAYLNCMRSPEGKDFWSKGVFREIVAPERLVMTDSSQMRKVTLSRLRTTD